LLKCQLLNQGGESTYLKAPGLRSVAVSRIRILVAVLLVLVGSGICAADVGADPAKENAELKARIEKLEKELAELKKIVMEQEAANTKAAVVKPTLAEPVKLEEKDIERIAAMVKAGEKKPVTSGLDIQLYGRLKFDAAFDTSRMSEGNFARWVESEASNKNDNELNLTANESRLGMWIYGPKDEEFNTSGRVEIDFFGGGSENKSNPMMRHAYMNLMWPDKKFSILAGQTSDVISPLVPYTLNYSVAWWAGNIGYRRPQIRLTKAFALDPNTELKVEAALARTIGSSGSFTPGDAGEDSGLPVFEGRVSLTFPWVEHKPTTIGFSGHWAKEEYDTDANGTSDKFDSWSLNLDITQPINEWLTIKGELFTGENLSAYLGGIGQGVRNIGTPSSPIYDKEISSKGGWVAASIGPCDKWSFNLGVTIDDPANNDLSSVSGSNREYNRSLFGNVIYSVDKNTEIGFELSQWHTEYVGQRDADSIRAQTSFIYKF